MPPWPGDHPDGRARALAGGGQAVGGDHSPVPHESGERGREWAHDMVANGRVDPVGADHEVSLGPRAVVEPQPHPVGVFFDPGAPCP